MTEPILSARRVTKRFGPVTALEAVSFAAAAGRVTCLLGDNGAGKSTLIKILSGVFPPDSGQVMVRAEEVRFGSPRAAMARGIATVYQDLAVIPLMSVWRNFFLGSEPVTGRGPLRRLDPAGCERIARQELAALGIRLRDAGQAVGTLSGGERQGLAIARALFLGARVLILDEPTAALGVKQVERVLGVVTVAKRRDVAVVLVTHNPAHAYAVGDRFVVLRRGRVSADMARDETSARELARLMTGATRTGHSEGEKA